MQQIVCYLPVENGKHLTEVSWGLMQEANKLKKIGSTCIGIVVHTGLAAEVLASLPFDKVYELKLNDEEWKNTENHVAALEALIETCQLTEAVYLFSSHPLYHEVAGRIAIRLQAGIVTNVMELRFKDRSSDLILKREIFQGKVHEFVSFQESKHYLITIDDMYLYAQAVPGSPLKVEALSIDKRVNNQFKLLSQTLLSWQELKITEARCVIGIGRGVYGASTKDILELAEILNAPIGGSKVADELGLIPREVRIGSSGQIIHADVYIAIGISGSSQHLEGIKHVKHIIAVNNDPSAPLFQRADLSIVGDFQEVIPQLVHSFKEERRLSEKC